MAVSSALPISREKELIFSLIIAKVELYSHLVTHTPTSRLEPEVPKKDPAIGGTDSGNLATATAK